MKKNSYISDRFDSQVSNSEAGEERAGEEALYFSFIALREM